MLAEPPAGGIPGGIIVGGPTAVGAIFAPSNLRRLLRAERSVPELYAMRRVRKVLSQGNFFLSPPPPPQARIDVQNTVAF